MHAPLQPGVSIGTVISNAPLYRPAPVVYVPQPVYWLQRVIYQPVWVHPGHKPAKWKYKQRHHREGRHGDHDD